MWIHVEGHIVEVVELVADVGGKFEKAATDVVGKTKMDGAVAEHKMEMAVTAAERRGTVEVEH